MKGSYFLLFLILLFFNTVNANNKPLFQLANTATKNNVIKPNYPEVGTILTLDKTALHQIYNSNEATIEISIPRLAKSNLEIVLHKKQILSEHFYVTTRSNLPGREKQNYKPGHYYQNTENSTFAAISIFEESLNGVISLDGTNYTLGEIRGEQKSDKPTYVFYDESLLIDSSFECETEEENDVDYPTITTDAIKMYPVVQNYLEIDAFLYNSYQQNVTETSNFITSLFNVMAAIFENEQIEMQISEISIWTTENNYWTYNSRLSGFRANTDCVNGDIAHYLHLGGGGRAYINGLCNGSNFANSGVQIGAPNDYPVYSRSVDVMAHETGHVLGSPHTHSCSWPGGVIDNCASPEGTCGPTDNPYPNTVMSYCSGYQDFLLGFGPLPGERIRSRVAAANCLEQINYVSIFETPTSGCPDDINSLDATLPNCQGCTYEWNDGVTGAIRMIDPSIGQDYCVLITDADGNQYADHFQYTLYDLSGEIEVENPESCGTGSARIYPSGGTGSYTFLWENGSTSNSQDNLSVGFYNITISDGLCSYQKAFEVNAVPSIVTNKSMGGSQSDQINRMIETSDGKLLIVGEGSGIGGIGPNNVGGQLGETFGSTDFWAVKTEVDGTIIWEQNYGGTGADICNDVISTQDGGYFLVGSSSSFDYDAEVTYDKEDGWIVKIDGEGNKQWTKKIGTEKADGFNKVIRSSDGNYIAVGQSNSGILNGSGSSFNIESQLYLVKFDEQANVIWEKDFGGNNYEQGFDLIISDDGSLYVAGTSLSPGIAIYDVFTDLYILKLDQSGNEIWSKSYGGSAREDKPSIDLDQNGGLFISATTYSSGGDIVDNNSTQSAWSLRIDQNGEILSSKIFGPNNRSLANDIIATDDGGYLIVGESTDYPFATYTFGNMFAAKVNASNEIVWFDSFGGDGFDTGQTVLKHSNGNLYFGGSSINANGDVLSNEGSYDYWLLGLNDNVLNNSFQIVASSPTIDNGPVVLSTDVPVINPIWSTGETTQNITITSAGTYTLTAGPANCTSTASITITGGCTDNDNDGVCQPNDCDDNNPNLPTTVGSSCDDNNPATTNDVILADGCTCQGIIIEGCQINLTISDAILTITGLTSTENAKLFDSDINAIWGCNPWNSTPCTDNETISGLTTGATYFISVQSDNCDEWIPIVIEGGNEPTCFDGIQNQGETGIDCGGPCPACPTCNDGIQNQGEEGVDCGGPCAPCETEVCTVEVSGGSVVAGLAPVFISGMTPNENIKLFNANFDVVFECAPWFATPCTQNFDVTVDIDQQPYFLSVQSDNCDEWIQVVFQEGCIDLDGDGFCSFEDCNDNEPFLPTTPGTPCNDNDASTENDVYQADGCMCMGTPITGCTVSVDAFYNGVFGGVEIEGLALSYNVKLFDADFNIVYECNPWASPQGCQMSYTYLVAQGGGTFYLSVQSEYCDEWIPITVPNDGECTDSDGDGFCDNEDCAPTNFTIPAPIGAPCNDFDSTTINDVIVSDECTCEGTPIGNGCNITVTETSFGQITVTGLSDVNNVKLFDETASSAGIVWECNPWSSACNNTEVINGLDAGVNYFLSVQKGDCDEWISFQLGLIPFNEDQSTAFQKNVLMNSDKFSIINLFPNPVKAEAFIQIESSFNDNILLEVFDLIGNKKIQQPINLEEGMNTIQLNTNQLATGIYNVVLYHKNGLQTARFIKN